MKIAVCISGLTRKNPEIHCNKIKSVFPNADFYYHTWNGRKYPNEFNVLTSPEPTVNYHPILDTNQNKSTKLEWYRKNKKNIPSKQLNATKQILAHKFLVCQLEKKYDIIIRTRWDAQISNNIDYAPYLEMAYDVGPVGFMTRFLKKDNINKLRVLEKNKSETNWYCYLPDVLIMHKPEHFDTEYVETLHKNKQLLPAEWGWYQTMSEPYGDIHTSIRGGVGA